MDTGTIIGLAAIPAIMYLIYYIDKVFNETNEKIKDLKKDIEKEEYDLFQIRVWGGRYRDLENLKDDFIRKEKDTKELINSVFPAPQLSNAKFIGDVNEINKKFFKIYDSLYLFLCNYPIEDREGREIVDKEEEKLRLLHEELIEIMKKLSILLIKNDIKIEGIEEDIQENEELLEEFQKNEDLRKELLRGATGYLSQSLLLEQERICKNCAYFTFLTDVNPYCTWWHHHPNSECEACINFKKKR